MTDEKKIERLLTAFYNGDTTQEEETLLQEFFNSSSLPEKWHTDKDLFHVLYDSSDICIPESLSERLENHIDKHIKETYNTNKKTHNIVVSSTKIKRILLNIGSIAAAILLLIGIFFFQNKHSVKNDMITDTFTDPREAAIAAEKVLTLVSSNLNKGLSPLEKVKESIDKTNELLNESLNLNE